MKRRIADLAAAEASSRDRRRARAKPLIQLDFSGAPEVWKRFARGKVRSPIST